MKVIYELFSLDESSLKNSKIFISKNLEKGDYYTNFLMLIYGQNKKILFDKLNLD